MSNELTATAVAQMKSDLDVAQTEIESLRLTNAMLTQERDILAVELTLARANASKELVRATSMSTIIRQTSIQLIEGIKRMDDAQRIQQEQALGIGGSDTPEFLKGRPIPPAGGPNDRFNARLLREAQAPLLHRPGRVPEPLERDYQPETIPPTVQEMRDVIDNRPRITGVVRSDIQDPRLPHVSPMPDEDVQNLQDLAGRLGVKR
jgi:hypothetical protein